MVPVGGDAVGDLGHPGIEATQGKARPARVRGPALCQASAVAVGHALQRGGVEDRDVFAAKLDTASALEPAQ